MLKILSELRIYISLSKHCSNEDSDLHFGKKQIICGASSADNIRCYGFSNKLKGWFPLLKVKAYNIELTHKESSTESNILDIDDYKESLRKILEAEECFIPDYAEQLSEIGNVLSHRETKENIDLKNILDQCDFFVEDYTKFIQKLRTEINKPISQQDLGKCYYEFFSEIHKFYLGYSEMFPNYVNLVLKQRPMLEMYFRKHSKNLTFSSMTLFFSLLINRFKYTVVRLEDISTKFKPQSRLQLNMEVAINCFNLLSACGSEVGRKSSLNIEAMTLVIRDSSQLHGNFEELYSNTYYGMNVMMDNVDEEGDFKGFYILIDNSHLHIIHLNHRHDLMKLYASFDILDSSLVDVPDTLTEKNLTLLTYEDRSYYIVAENIFDKEKLLNIYQSILEHGRHIPYWRFSFNSCESDVSNTLEMLVDIPYRVVRGNKDPSSKNIKMNYSHLRCLLFSIEASDQDDNNEESGFRWNPRILMKK